MKKFLLTFAAATTMFAANAAVTLAINDKNNVTVDGTYADTEYKEDNSVKTYAHYQPITKFECEGYSFTFAGGSTEAAYYDAKNANSWTLRCYVDNVMTVTAPAGTKMYAINFTSSNATAGKFSMSANNGTVNYETLTAVKWANEEGAESVAITFGGTIRFSAIEIVTAEGETPDTPDTPDTPETPDTPDYDLRLCLNDATEIEGTFVAEQSKEENPPYGSAAHYEDVSSFVVGNYYFSTTKTEDTKTAPAFYLPMSTSTTGNNNMRVYAGTKLNVYAPEGTKVTKLVFDGSNFANGLSGEANVGTVTVDMTNSKAPTLTWEYAEGASDISILASGSWRFYNVDVYTLSGSTGVESVESVPVVYVNGNSIVAPEGAAVYSVNGVLCGTENLQSGLYVVVVGQKAVKVLVK